MADAHGDLEPSRTDLTTMRGAESTAGLEATGPPFILSWVDLSDDDVTRLYDQLADRTPATTAQDRACLAADPADIAAILQKIPAVQRFLPQVSPRHGALSDVSPQHLLGLHYTIGRPRVCVCMSVDHFHPGNCPL